MLINFCRIMTSLYIMSMCTVKRFHQFDAELGAGRYHCT